MKKDWSAGAGAKCDLLKLGVRTRVRAHLNLDVRGACVRPKKRSQLTPCKIAPLAPPKFLDFIFIYVLYFIFFLIDYLSYGIICELWMT